MVSFKDPIDILVRGILIQNGKVLLLERTVEKGGGYNLVGGHVEKGESPADGLVREIEEEIGVKVERSQVELIRVVFRNKINSSPKLHLVFWVSSWLGEPKNLEPRKCLGLSWFALDQLPEELATVAGIVLRAGQDDPFYIEVNGKLSGS
ncbi:MAG: NUDIX domain-containing protein [Bacteroidia bacterium]|nr:NUDIX domain-containing protein [Bacteroidia bacterium]